MRFSLRRACVILCVTLAGAIAVSRALADDAETCANGTDDEKVAACTRAIESGHLQGNVLAIHYRNRGLAYRNKGNDDRAVADLDTAIRIDPSFAEAYRIRGIAYRNKGDYDRAIADHSEAIRLDPKSVRAYVGRGLDYHAKGKLKLAIDDYTEAIRLDPTHASAYSDRCLAYLDEMSDLALADCDEAIGSIRIWPRPTSIAATTTTTRTITIAPRPTTTMPLRSTTRRSATIRTMRAPTWTEPRPMAQGKILIAPSPT